MYLTRSSALRRLFVLRSHDSSTRAAQTVLAENKRKVRAYKTLQHSRLLWEQSAVEENKYAFVPNRAMREAEETTRRESSTQHLREFEAPEKYADKAMKQAAKPWKKVLHNDRDAPINEEERQLWYSPEELMPIGEDAAPIEADDDDEYSGGGEEAIEDEAESILIAREEEKRKQLRKKRYLETHGAKAQTQPQPEPEEVSPEVAASEEYQAKLKLAQEEARILEASARKFDEMENPGEDITDTPLTRVQEEVLAAKEFNDMEANQAEMEEEEEEEMYEGNKRCLMCGINAPKLHPMNTYLLARFLSPHGDIIPRKITGVCMRHQRDISHVFRQAKQLGLLTFKKGFYIHNPYEPIPEHIVTSERVVVSDREPTAITEQALAEEVAIGEVSPEDIEMQAEVEEEMEEDEMDEYADELDENRLPHRDIARPIQGLGDVPHRASREERGERSSFPQPPRSPINAKAQQQQSQGQEWRKGGKQPQTKAPTGPKPWEQQTGSSRPQARK